jgi:hypothetical protein
MAMATEHGWKYLLTESGLIRVIDKDSKSNEIEAIDMAISCPFFLNVANDALFEQIKVGQNYQATFKVFNAKMKPTDLKELAEVTDAKTAEELKQKGGGNFWKVELVSVKKE